MKKTYTFVVLLFAVSMAFAIPQGLGVLRNNQMDAVLSDVNCKTDFNTGVLESYIAAAPSSASVLTTFTAKLEADTNQLSVYAENNDTANFRLFLRETYEKDSKDAKAQLVRVRRESNLSNETKISLREKYHELKAEYDSCHSQAVRSFTTARVESYEGALSNFESRLDDLESKGLDVNQMRALVSNARSVVVNPLRNALLESNTSAQLRIASRQYCMFDGCGNGTDFHLGAKFEIEKLTSVLNRIKETNVSANISAKIVVAEGFLVSAQTQLDDLNNGKYTDESRSHVWDSIQSAADEIRDILHDIREENADQRREHIQQRVDEIRNVTRQRVEEIRNQTQERREEIRNETQERRDENRQRIEDNRERIRGRIVGDVSTNVSASIEGSNGGSDHESD